MIRTDLNDIRAAGSATGESRGRIHAANPTVAVVGIGGGGTWGALALAAAGVRRFRLLDMDRIEASNLNRQVTYCPQDVGRLKVDVLAERLEDWVGAKVECHHARISGPNDALACLAGADFAVCAVDLPLLEIQGIMTRALREARVPGFFIGHGLPVNRVGPTVLPGMAGCPACFRRADLEAVPWVRDNFDYASHAGTALAPCFAYISAYLVAEVERCVARKQPMLWRALVEVDFSSWHQEICRLEEPDLCQDCRELDRPLAIVAPAIDGRRTIDA